MKPMDLNTILNACIIRSFLGYMDLDVILVNLPFFEAMELYLPIIDSYQICSNNTIN